jgi:hypothetical protein
MLEEPYRKVEGRANLSSAKPLPSRDQVHPTHSPGNDHISVQEFSGPTACWEAPSLLSMV